MKHPNKIVLVSMGAVENIVDIPLFLINMFNDPFILPIKQPLRLIAASAITLLRLKETLRILKTTPSPLKQITKQQANFLKKLSGKDVLFYFVYSRPKLKYHNDTTYIAMYNFYSHTTHGKILKTVKRIKPPFCIYPEFFDLVKARINRALYALNPKDTAVLLSAHSIPLKLAKNDPYMEDLKTFQKYLNRQLKMPVFLSFQSRLGKIEWLKPYTEDEIKRLSKFYRNLIVVPISFPAENTETINEIDITYKNLAYKCGFKTFKRTACFNENKGFIKLLKTVALKELL